MKTTWSFSEKLFAQDVNRLTCSVVSQVDIIISINAHNKGILQIYLAGDWRKTADKVSVCVIPEIKLQVQFTIFTVV